MENSIKGSQKIENTISLGPSNSTSGYRFEEIQDTDSKESMHPYIHCSIIYNSQDVRKQAKCPLTDKWIKKTWHMYTMDCHSDIKKNEILSSEATWMSLEGIVLSELSQTAKTNTVWFHLYVESENQNKLTNETETNL